MVMTAGASRKSNQRTSNDQEDLELKDLSSDYKILSTGVESDEDESDSKVHRSDYNYRKFFNESDIKFQNANNYYKRKPHRP